jgi:predicted nucleic acid-binding protein
MCLIVDANRASLVFGEHPEFAPVRDWLQQGDGILIVGGHLAAELSRVEKARRFVVQLQRAGIARQVPAADVAREEAVVRETGLCQSNDSHVVALARVSGARTLCSEDRDLWSDFQNQHLVSKPRGKIYRTSKHAHLLRHTTSCKRRDERR